MNWTIIGDISNLFATAFAAFSIFITIREQKESRKKEKERTITEQNLNWYNEVALNDIVKNLSLFINEAENILDLCKNTEHTLLDIELQNAYTHINENFKSLSTKALLLRIFSYPLYQQCNESIQKIFDLYSETINDAASKKYFSSKNGRNIQEEYISIISKLYLYKSNFVKENT